jgi:nucleotide-binding universal stress UspA family protein
MYRIVVGIDGSKEARRALEWATEEASQRGGHLHLVHTYEVPTAVGVHYSGVVDTAPFAKRAQETARERMAKALDEVPVPEGVSRTHETVEGMQPAPALIQRAADADLLVVGSRGRGGFAGLLLGSVSQQCAAHAPCPVVVVR